MKRNEQLEVRFLGLVIKMSDISWKGIIVVVCLLVFFWLILG